MHSHGALAESAKDDGSFGIRSLHYAPVDDSLVYPFLLRGGDIVPQIPEHHCAAALLLQDSVFSNSKLFIRCSLVAGYVALLFGDVRCSPCCMEQPCQVMTNTVVVRGFGEQQRLTAEYAVGALDSVSCAGATWSHLSDFMIRTYVGFKKEAIRNSSGSS